MKTEAEASPPESDSAESHFSSYAEPLVREAIAHASALEADPDAEVLHKLRVALRRLRSLLWAYRPLLDSGLDDRQRALFKQLAGSAGQTRDWDILIEILGETVGPRRTPFDRLRAARAAASERSREELSHASMSFELQDAVTSSSAALNETHKNTSLKRFARKRLDAAEKSLHKRMRVASRSKRSNYAAYHEVRKAGKKVRYLLDFFEPLLGTKQLKTVKELKRIQKRFGSLNDVVASEALINNNPELFKDDRAVRDALRILEKERKHRVRAAAKLL
ncbi:CHAD domain-containing protein [Paraburkholderia sp. HD33-4]|uniref:CHAD domain-containing protein n=1 Tax=Paraburkholderia sp. HD33-4 TaxID=2883242 RepID=UPI001F1B5123|nr:CHAD domain-containing protein [Paraburkholderia sp. HD33-4]